MIMLLSIKYLNSILIFFSNVNWGTFLCNLLYQWRKQDPLISIKDNFKNLQTLFLSLILLHLLTVSFCSFLASELRAQSVQLGWTSVESETDSYSVVVRKYVNHSPAILVYSSSSSINKTQYSQYPSTIYITM